jgi:hypothetical protein
LIVVRAFTLLVAFRMLALRAAGLDTFAFVIRALFWAFDSRFAISILSIAGESGSRPLGSG